MFKLNWLSGLLLGASSVEYEKVTESSVTGDDTQYAIIVKSDSKYYALTNNSSSLSWTEVTVSDDTTTDIGDNQQWFFDSDDMMSNSGKYLTADYDSKSVSLTSESQDALEWTHHYGSSKYLSTKFSGHSTTYYLIKDSDDVKVNDSAGTLYLFKEKAEEPEPDYEVTPTTEGVSLDIDDLASEDSVVLRITNTSSASKSYTPSVTGTSGCISLSETSFSIATKKYYDLTVNGLKKGTATINLASTGGSSTYKATIVVKVDGGGEDPEPEPDVTVKMTPGSKGKEEPIPSEEREVDVNESVKVVLENSSSSKYTYTISCEPNDIVESDKTSIELLGNGSGSATFTALKEGTVKITFRNNNTQGGADYERFAYLTLNVGGVTPPAPSGNSTFLGFTSDVHNSTNNLSKWITNAAEAIDTEDVDNDFDNFGICGDLVSSSYNDTEVNNVTDVVKNSEDVIKDGFFVTGNHENSMGGGSFDFKSHTKYEEPGKYFEGDNYYIYSMGARQWDEIYHPQNDSDTVKDMDNLESFLEGVDSDVPVFVLAHFPLHDFNGHSTSGGDGHGGTSGLHDGKRAYNSYRMAEVMSDYPNVFFLWGHNHSSSTKYYDKIYNNDSPNGLPTTDMGDYVEDSEFTYAAAGCMKGQSGISGYGLVVEIIENDNDTTTVTLEHYGLDGKGIGDKFSTTFGGGTPATKHTITATAGEHGSINPSESVEVTEGKSKTFTFTPDAGYVVDKVTVDGKEVQASGNSYTITNVTKDGSINVTFKESDYLWEVTPTTDNPTKSVTLKANGQYLIQVTNAGSSDYTFSGTFSKSGIATLSPASAQIAQNDTNDFTINTANVNGSTTLTIQNSNSYGSQYARKATLNITVTGGEDPEPPTPATDSVDVTPSTENPTATATIKAGNTLAVNIKNGTEHENAWSYNLTSGDKTVADVLDGSSPTDELDGGEVGTINVTGLKAGKSTLKITNNNEGEYERTAVIELTVTGETPPADQFTITATAGDNGTVSPASATVNKGGSATFTFNPADGYVVDTVKVDEKPVTVTGNSYTFTNVTATHTISVTFKSGSTPIDVTEVSISGYSSVQKDNSIVLTAQAKPEGATIRTVNWESSNDNVTIVPVADTLTAYVIGNVVGSTTVYVTVNDVRSAGKSITITKAGGGGGGGGGTGGGGGGSSASGPQSTAPAYSPRWQKRADGKWYITRTNGQLVTNAWLCDDVIPSNGKFVWYLIQADGTMLTAGLVQDKSGNYYSMEMDPHNQHYGMLRYKSGYYNCNGQQIYLELEEKDISRLGAIKNADAIAKLKAAYGLTTYPIGNENAVYTSNF